jgi:hypothetical protein
MKKDRPMERAPKPAKAKRIAWWVFSGAVTLGAIVVTASAVGLAKWLDGRVGLAGILIGCALISAGLLWMTSKVE